MRRVNRQPITEKLYLFPISIGLAPKTSNNFINQEKNFFILRQIILQRDLLTSYTNFGIVYFE